jgi:hypothetical protein
MIKTKPASGLRPCVLHQAKPIWAFSTWKKNGIFLFQVASIGYGCDTQSAHQVPPSEKSNNFESMVDNEGE